MTSFDEYLRRRGGLENLASPGETQNELVKRCQLWIGYRSDQHRKYSSDPSNSNQPNYPQFHSLLLLLLESENQLWSHFVWSFRSQSTCGNGSLCWLGFCDLTNYGDDWFAGPLWPVRQRLHRLIKPDLKRSINPNQNLSQYQNGSKKFNTGRTKPKRLWT